MKSISEIQREISTLRVLEDIRDILKEFVEEWKKIE